MEVCQKIGKALEFKNGVSTKNKRSFENRGRKVRGKCRPGSKRASRFFFLILLGLSGYLYIFLASTKLWAL